MKLKPNKTEMKMKIKTKRKGNTHIYKNKTKTKIKDLLNCKLNQKISGTEEKKRKTK